MSRKCGVCESCNKHKLLYEIKKRDLTTKEVKETLHWWCSDCYYFHVDKAKIPVYWKSKDVN